MTKDPYPIESAVAELLDNVLTARRHYYLCPDEPENAAAQEALAAERELAKRLVRLRSPAPFLLLAQAVYATVENGTDMFADAKARDFDYEKVAAKAEDNTYRLLARVVIGLEELCAGGEVAAVVARHRVLARRDAEFSDACYAVLEPVEVAALAAEGEQARELQAAAAKMRAVMVENRRLAEQLAAVQPSPPPDIIAAE